MSLLGQQGEWMVEALDLAVMRHRVLSANIANVDTPGYKARTVGFDDVLKKAVVAEREDVVPREDGNTVVMEREQADLRKNQLVYRVFMQSLIQRVRTMRSAIAGRGA